MKTTTIDQYTVGQDVVTIRNFGFGAVSRIGEGLKVIRITKTRIVVGRPDRDFTISYIVNKYDEVQHTVGGSKYHDATLYPADHEAVVATRAKNAELEVKNKALRAARNIADQAHPGAEDLDAAIDALKAYRATFAN